MYLQMPDTSVRQENSKVNSPRALTQTVRMLSMSSTDAVWTEYAEIFE